MEFINKTITRLEGTATKPIEVTSKLLYTSFDGVVDYLRNDSLVDNQKAVIVIDKENGTITFESNIIDSSAPQVTIKGVIVLHRLISDLSINKNKYYSLTDFKALIRNSRRYFTSLEMHAKLMDSLQNFKASIDKHIEDADDKKGNVTYQYITKLKTDMDLFFILDIPLIKNIAAKCTFKVDIDVQVRERTVEFAFDSVELEEQLDLLKDQIIDSTISNLNELGYKKVLFNS